jgi:hypothetical protein
MYFSNIDDLFSDTQTTLGFLSGDRCFRFLSLFFLISWGAIYQNLHFFTHMIYMMKLCFFIVTRKSKHIQDLRDVESAMLRFSGHNEKTEFHHINHMGEEMQVLVNCTPGNQEKQRQETEAAISRQEA